MTEILTVSKDSWNIILDWLKLYYQNGFFLILAATAWGYLFISRKELRGRFLVPIAVLLMVVVNPVLSTLIYSQIVYWRLLWILPCGLLIGLAVVRLLEQAEKRKLVWLKWVTVAALAIGIMLGGKEMFTHGGFIERENWEKVSQDTKDVCDIILEIDESPRIVAPANIFAEIRQYAPQIEMLYGRNAQGFIGIYDWKRVLLWNELQTESLNYDNVIGTLIEYQINFWVVDNEVDVQLMEQSNYLLIYKNEKFMIFYNKSSGDMSR